MPLLLYRLSKVERYKIVYKSPSPILSLVIRFTMLLACFKIDAQRLFPASSLFDCYFVLTVNLIRYISVKGTKKDLRK